MAYETVMNAFLPTAEIEDPQRFAGRLEQVRDLTSALHMVGSIPLIIGQRGLGKSSLALQLTRIAQGDVELLSELDLERLALPEEQRFITFYVKCTDSIGNLNGLLGLMINAVEAHKAVLDHRAADKYELIDKTTRRAVSLKIFSSETTRRYAEASDKISLKRLSAAERLVHLTETLTDVYKQPVLFVVDELDRIAPLRGLASFLKSTSSSILKFAFVGIATNQSELIADHESLPRQLVAVKVPRMNEIELESIVERTEEYLAERGEQFRFSKRAKERLSAIASGFPWFVHVVGQAALLGAEESVSRDISLRDVESALQGLATRRFAPQYFDLYQKVVRDSPPREYLIRLCAMWELDDIPTSEIYPRAKRLGVAAPANYLGHLTQEQCGSVLVRSHTQSRALYRFRDEMFKAYVRVRPSLYDGFKEDVEAAMQA